MRRVLAIAVLCCVAGPAWATVYYADNTLGSPCTDGTYSEASRTCGSGSDGNAYNTPAGAIAPVVAGDTIVIRGGTWTELWGLSEANKSGDPGAYITLEGFPGEWPVLQYDDRAGFGADEIKEGPGPVSARGNRGYFIFRNFILDGSVSRRSSRLAFRDGNHHMIIENVEIKNFYGSGIYTANGANQITVIECHIHDQRLVSGIDSNHYGIYISYDTSNVLVERNHIHDNPGGGIHVYNGGHPGSVTSNIVIRNNSIHHNQFSPFSSSAVGGIIVSQPTGTYSGIEIYNNLVFKNGLLAAHPNPSGITVKDADNVKIWGNTIYSNKGYGVNIQPSSSGGATTGTLVQDNIITGNTIAETIDGGTSTTMTFNGCLSADTCGTSKVTLTSDTQCFVNESIDDYRLKQGTNPCRNSGTAVASRPAPVGVTDIGAYEQGELASAVVVGTIIEVNAAVMTPPLTPSTGITGVTITCIGCTGSPVATVSLKSGASTVMQVSISGLSTSGSCSLNLGSTNLQGSGYVGMTATGSAQGVNSVTGLSVSGTCANTSGVGGGGGSLYSRLLLEDGSGTTAADSSGNAHPGTVSSGVTWVTGADGGVTIPTDATYRHVDIGYGSGINPTTQSYTNCAYVVVDLAAVPTVVGGTVNGIDRRAYYGVQTVGGQTQWGIGIQGSGFSTGSEFVATANKTFVCILFDAATDTATLRVNDTYGTIVGKSIKTYTSYTLASHLRVGNDGTNTTSNGGFTVYGIWTWDSLASDADLDAVYAGLSPDGTPNPCYKQDAHKWERIYTDGTNPIAVGLTDSSILVPDGGGVALNIQITCTGSAGTPVVFRFFYTSDGTTYQEIPALLGAGGIAMWGSSTALGLNNGATVGRISGSLTPTPGVTLATLPVSPAVEMALDSAYEIRLLLRLAPGLTNQFRSILVKQDNGLDLANAPTIGPARIDIRSPQGGGGP